MALDTWNCLIELESLLIYLSINRLEQLFAERAVSVLRGSGVSLPLEFCQFISNTSLFVPVCIFFLKQAKRNAPGLLEHLGLRRIFQ